MSTSLAAVVFDCHDAATLARFWADALGQPIDGQPTADFAALGPAGGGLGPRLMFIKVPEPKQGKNRLHVDLSSADPDKEIDRLCGLGAVRAADFDEGGIRWTTLRDPEGNEFDVAGA